MPSVNRKKILFLITKSNWGGAQRYVYDLATSLDQNSYEPVVVLGGDGELTQKLEAAGIRTIALSSLQRDISLSKELRSVGALYRIVRTERPDILHVNSSKAGGVGCLVGRLCGVPRIIFTAHGWAFNEDRPRWQAFVIKYFHWLTVLLSHHTIAVSHAIVYQMDWPLAEQKMTVINPGRTIPAFVDKAAARAELVRNCPTLMPFVDDQWVMTIAELHPIKQHERLFDAIKAVIATHPRVRLVCVGDGALRTTLAQYVTEHGLEQHIFLTGAIHEAATLLKAADLFVLASKSESYGYVLHEAGLAGVPIIATRVGGITDIISDTTGTLIDTADASTLSAAIADVVATPQPYRAKATTLTSQLAERTVAAMTRHTVSVYENGIPEASSS